MFEFMWPWLQIQRIFSMGFPQHSQHAYASSLCFLFTNYCTYWFRYIFSRQIAYRCTFNYSFSLRPTLSLLQMEAKLLQHSWSPRATFARRRYPCKRMWSPVVAVLTTPMEIITEEARKTTSGYNDNWFEQIAINHLSRSVQAATGLCQ